MPTTLVIADPYPVVIEGILRTLASEPDFEVLATVADSAAALDAVRSLRPDILILDFFEQPGSAARLLKALREEKLPTRPVLFTIDHQDDIVEAVRLGVQGIITKDMPLFLLLRCLREVRAGRTFIEKRIAENTVKALLNGRDADHPLGTVLTPRESLVARLVGEGHPNKTVASQLDISEGTVKLHLHRIYKKLGVRSRVALMRYLERAGEE